MDSHGDDAESLRQLAATLRERFGERLRQDRGIELGVDAAGRGTTAIVMSATKMEAGGSTQIAVRFARKNLPVSELASDIGRLSVVLEGAKEAFVLPLRLDGLDDDEWRVSFWEWCHHTLEQELQTLPGGRMEVQPLVGVICRVAQALDHLRNQVLLHGDVSPNNILLSREDRRHYVAKLGDFDTLLEREPKTAPPFLWRGTPRYCAPDFDSASIYTADLYSLAACYLRSRTGKAPEDGDLEVYRRDQLIPGLGVAESRVVLAALSREHRHREAFATRQRIDEQGLHAAWVASLQQALAQDREPVFDPIAKLGARGQVTVGLFGIGKSGKTTLVASIAHPRAGRTRMELQPGRRLAVRTAPGEDGRSSATLNTLRGLLKELTTGRVAKTITTRVSELRFEVEMGGRCTLVTTHDYGGERVEPEDDNKEKKSDELLRGHAKCDVLILLVAPDRPLDKILHSIQNLRNYLVQELAEQGDRPQPAVLVVYTKADSIAGLNLDDEDAVSAWVHQRWVANGAGGHAGAPGLELDLTRLRTDLPAAIEVMPVSAQGTEYVQVTPEEAARNGDAIVAEMWPKYVWLMLGKAVELACRQFDRWAETKLKLVDRLVSDGRPFAAARALEQAMAALTPYLVKFPEARPSLDARRATIAAVVGSARRKWMSLLAAVGVLLAAALAVAGTAWARAQDRAVRDGLLLEVASWRQLSDPFEREARGRQLLASEPLRDRLPELVDEIRATYEIDLETAERAELERARLWRSERTDRAMAKQRQDYTAARHWRTGRFRTTYDEWDKADGEDLYAHEESSAVRALLAAQNSPAATIEAIRAYRSRFPRGSRDEDVAALEARARQSLREQAIEAAVARAKELETNGAQVSGVAARAAWRAATLAAWRAAALVAAGSDQEALCRNQIAAHEAALDAEEYDALVTAADQIVQKGGWASRESLEALAKAQQEYLSAQRAVKNMSSSVQASRTAVRSLLDRGGQLVVRLDWVRIPSNCRVSSASSKIPAEFFLQSQSGFDAYNTGLKVYEIEEPLNGHELSVTAAWGEMVTLGLRAIGNDTTKQTTTLVAGATTMGEVDLSLRPEDRDRGEAACRVRFKMTSKGFDSSRITMPPYAPK